MAWATAGGRGVGARAAAAVGEAEDVVGEEAGGATTRTREAVAVEEGALT